MTIKDYEENGFNIFKSTVTAMRPEYTVTSTNDYENREFNFLHYDADVVTPEGNHYEIEIKMREDYRLDDLPDFQIDERKILKLQEDIKENKCERAFIATIYPFDGVMYMWEVYEDRTYHTTLEKRPDKTVGRTKYVEKRTVTLQFKDGLRIKIKKY